MTIQLDQSPSQNGFAAPPISALAAAHGQWVLWVLWDAHP